MQIKNGKVASNYFFMLILEHYCLIFKYPYYEKNIDRFFYCFHGYLLWM